jgi:putative ABC transport system substrate-binding protein
MKRRELITLVGGAAALPLAARAKQPERMNVIGFLGVGSKNIYVRGLSLFQNEMRELGYEEGREIRYEYRYADSYPDRLPDLATELVELKPSVIVAVPLQAIQAAQRATRTIPIVMASTADPVGFGLVTSLSHPGGNVTGLANFAELLAPKLLELLRDLISPVNRIAMLVNLSNPLHVPQVREMRAATSVAGPELVLAEIGAPMDLPIAFETIARANVDGLIVPPDIVLQDSGQQIADFAARARLPTVYGNHSHIQQGGLLSYAPDSAALYRRAATYVDKILKGERPADIPVEQPTRFELAINLKTANALGLSIPPTLLARADEVIE